MRTRSLLGLALLALIALVAMLLATLPASLVIQAFDPSDRLVRAEGSVWAGQARWQQPGQQPLLIEWRWTGGRTWRWQAADGQTELHGLWRPERTLVLPEVRGRLSMDRLDVAQWLRVSRPLGFLELELAQVELLSGAIPQARGELFWREAALAGAIDESLGVIRLTLMPGAEGLQVDVASLEPAPIMLRGRIDLDDDHYRVDLWMRADPARPELQAALADLGEPQPDGQVRLRLGGVSGW